MDALDTSSVTTALVQSFPESLRSVVVAAYADALASLYLYLAPLFVLGFVLLLVMPGQPLPSTSARAAEEAPERGFV